MTTYTQGIPDGNHTPAADWSNMQDNTNAIFNILDVDMITFNQSTSGYHSKVTYVNKGSNPSPVAGSYIAYSKQSAGQSELFAVRDSTVAPVQLTRGTPGTNANGSYSYLPGGFLIQWGSFTTAVPVVHPVTFPVAFTSPPVVTASFSTDGNADIASVTNTGFSFTTGTLGTGYWMAIGV